MPQPHEPEKDDNKSKESFCFAVLNPKQCSIAKDGNPRLAYDCHALNSDGKSADDTVLVPMLITDSEGVRRHKAAITIAAHFANADAELNVSLSTVIFG